MNNKEWSWEDYDYLYKHYNTVPISEIAEHLGRSISSVNSHAEKLGLFPIFTPVQKDINLIRTYHKQLGNAVIFLTPTYSTAMVEDVIKCGK